MEPVDRMAIKAEMLRDRNPRKNRCQCDCCKNVFPLWSLHKHEIYKRSRTNKNSEARAAAESKFLSSILCPNCHEQADLPNNQEKLLLFNVGLYGKDAVKEAILTLEQYLGRKTGLILPDENGT